MIKTSLIVAAAFGLFLQVPARAQFSLGRFVFQEVPPPDGATCIASGPLDETERTILDACFVQGPLHRSILFSPYSNPEQLDLSPAARTRLGASGRAVFLGLNSTSDFVGYIGVTGFATIRGEAVPFNFPGATGTTPRSINNHLQIAGDVRFSNDLWTTGFFFDPAAGFRKISPPPVTIRIPSPLGVQSFVSQLKGPIHIEGISQSGYAVGTISDDLAGPVAFLCRDRCANFEIISPGTIVGASAGTVALSIRPRAINDQGEVVGEFISSEFCNYGAQIGQPLAHCLRGFSYLNGRFEALGPQDVAPGLTAKNVSVTLSGINNKGIRIGTYHVFDAYDHKDHVFYALPASLGNGLLQSSLIGTHPRPSPLQISPASYVFICSPNGHLIEWQKQSHTGEWKAVDHSAEQGALQVSGNPAALYNGAIHVFASSTNNQLIEFYREGPDGPMSVYDLSTGLNAPPLGGSPVVVFNGSVHVYARSADNRLLEWYKEMSPAPWQVFDLSTPSGAGPIDGDPAVVFNGAIHVYARSVGGRLLEWYKEMTPAPWQVFDLSDANGAGPISGNPAAVFNGAMHVYARSADSRLLEWYKEMSAAPWQVFNLSTAPGAAPIAGDPSAVFDRTMHIFARTVDGRLLAWYKEMTPAPWQVFDTSSQAGGVSIVGEPAALWETDANTMHIFATATQSRLIEFFKDPNPAPVLVHDLGNGTQP